MRGHCGVEDAAKGLLRVVVSLDQCGEQINPEYSGSREDFVGMRQSDLICIVIGIPLMN